MIIPCYNGGQWLEEAIESCRAQSYQSVELIVVDDGSDDNSVEIVRKYVSAMPERVRLHRQKSSGAPAARNQGVALSRGAFLLFLDADDYLHPDALKFLVQAATDGADVVFGNVRLVDADGATLSVRDQTPQSNDWLVALLTRSIQMRGARTMAPLTSSVLFRRKVLDQCSWDSSLPCAQELALLLNCAIRGLTFGFTPNVVASIRQHETPSRISTKTGKILRATIIDLLLRSEQELISRGAYDTLRKTTIHNTILDLLLSEWRAGNLEYAEWAFRHVDRRLIRKMADVKPLSFKWMTTIAGLRGTQLLWRCQLIFRRGSERNERV